MRRAFIVFSLVFLLPSLGQAQHSGGVAMSGAHFSAAPAPMAAPRVVASARPIASVRPVARAGRVSTRVTAAPRTVHPAGWNTGTRRKTVPADPEFPNGNLAFDGFPVPGLGFDFPHFFATHPNFGRHCQHCFGFDSGFIVPFINGGFYLPTLVSGEPAASPPAEETDAGAEQLPAEEPPARETLSGRGKPQAVPAQQEYVFVKRDGTLIFAVAYSWINDRLQYVTEEGIRRTVSRNALDIDATQQFNDQRGVPIQPPA